MTDIDRVLQDYMDDVRRSEMYTAAVEREMFRTYRTCPRSRCKYTYVRGDSRQSCPSCKAPRDRATRDKLIMSVARFVMKMARDYANCVKKERFDNRELLKNLISAGNLGVVIAVDKFDTTRGLRFMTYAPWWARHQILEELRRSELLRIPTYKQKELRLLGEEAQQALYAEVLELTDTDVELRHADDLELNVNTAHGLTRVYEAFNALMLSGIDRYIILAYHGIKEPPKTLRQIAKMLFLSGERVRQRKTGAMARLNDYFRLHPLSNAANSACNLAARDRSPALSASDSDDDS